MLMLLDRIVLRGWIAQNQIRKRRKGIEIRRGEEAIILIREIHQIVLLEENRIIHKLIKMLLLTGPIIPETDLIISRTDLTTLQTDPITLLTNLIIQLINLSSHSIS